MVTPSLPKFTVAIRVYNAADRLPALLEALKAQTDATAFDWEVLIVDNCSTDNTAEIVQQFQADWPLRGPLRYCLEIQQGAIFARQRAIQEARGEWIGFLDDDNLPRADWVAACHAFSLTNPKTGACGSQIHGQFEIEPPPNFDRIAQFLPVIERDHAVCFTEGLYARKQVLPPGAGLMIQRRAWLETVPERLNLSGPIGNGLAAKGEDTEALSHMKQAGWEIWFNPEMHITHLIPQWRFERDYLQRFFRGIGIGRYYTRMLRVPLWLYPLMTVLYFCNDLRKLVGHHFRYAATIEIDLVASCEQELLRASLLSPLYYFNRRLNRPLSRYWGRSTI